MVWTPGRGSGVMADVRQEGDELPRVAVTEMTRLLYCETQVALHHRYGSRVEATNAAASARGVREHERHDQDVRRFHRAPAASDDSRCFIATAVYGPASWQVAVLRRFRDTVLLDGRAGRLFVCLYYGLIPSLARVAGKHSRVRRALPRFLDACVARIGVGDD